MKDPVRTMIEEALAAPIHGWDFSWLEGRAEETRPPWDYAKLVRSGARAARRMLDIDTGGGEFLERCGPFSGLIVATEGYPPNVAVASRRLAPLGISVLRAASAPDNVDQVGTSPQDARSPLPFASNIFDLVIDRHASYWPSETWRVLAGGGRFLTQQRSEAETSGLAWEDLFGRQPHSHLHFDLTFATEQLAGAGFQITRAEDADTPMVFYDLAGVVYYLRLVPWAVDGFDPARDSDALEAVHDRIRTDGELRVRGSHMLIDALKPRVRDADGLPEDEVR